MGSSVEHESKGTKAERYGDPSIPSYVRWQIVKRFPKQEPADRSAGVSSKIVRRENRYNVLVEKSKVPASKEALASFSEAAAKIDPSHHAAFLAETRDVPGLSLWRYYFYLEDAFSQVSVVSSLSKKMWKLIHFQPLSHIPESIYKTSAHWINKIPTSAQGKFVTWATSQILSGEGSQEALFVEVAMVLRSNPHALTPHFLALLRESPMYQGEDKLGLIVWIVGQASKADIGCGLYSWAHVLLPLVRNYESCSRQSMDLILQFVEIILSHREARAILVSGAVWEGERLIPPSSFEILLRLTFPASSPRVKATKRFEAVYPLLKEVALAPESATGGNAVKQIFTFSLKLAGEEGNPGLAKEAAAIAIWCVTENVDCFQEWDILYEKHLEGSVALLRELVDRSPELSSSPYHACIVNRTLKSFRLKNEGAITGGGANWSLHKEADKSCKQICRRLSSRSGGFNIKEAALLVLASASGAAALTCSFYYAFD